MFLQFLQTTYKTARRVAVAMLGGTVLIIGIIMIVAPGPAFIVIPAGLGILSLEFVWAKRWLKKVRQKADEAMQAVRSNNGEAKGPDVS